MRSAGRAGGVGIAAAIVLLGAVAALWWRASSLERLEASMDEDALMAWSRLAVAQPPPPPPRWIEPPDRRARRHGAPVPRAVSAGLPAWFGDAAAAPVRIAGRVFGARPRMSVRIAIGGPDPSVWAGRVTAIADDGRFDFGPMRRGAYVLVAEGDGWASRLTPWDTTDAPAEEAELFVYACRATGFAIQLAASDEDDHGPRRPASGVQLALAGRVIGTTDAAGRATVCVVERADVQIDAPGYRLQDPLEDDGQVTLAEAYAHDGVVVEADGSPAHGVGVQPIWRGRLGMSCVDADVIATADARGRFRFEGQPALCGLRIVHGAVIEEVGYPLPLAAPASRDAAVLVPLRVPSGERLVVRLAAYALSSSRDLGWWLRGRVVDDRGPVGDARVKLRGPVGDDMRGPIPQVVYARSDGRFQLWVTAVSEPVLRLEAADPDHRLVGRLSVTSWPRPLDEATLTLGPGAQVVGTVVDERGRPLAGVSVTAGDTGIETAPVTRLDGAYQLALGAQGRYRLHVFDARGRELAPLAGKLPPAVDVVSPRGTRGGVRISVRRGSADEDFTYATRNDGTIDLGAQLEDGAAVRVGDEAAAAGMRVGDEVVWIDRVPRPGHDVTCATEDFSVAFGATLDWQVRRTGKVRTLHARAPALAADEAGIAP